MITILFVLVLSILASSTEAAYCEDDFTLSELPHGLLLEALSMITKGTIESFLGCEENVKIDEDKVKLWLYTRDNPEIPVLLNKNNPVLDTNKPIKLLIPGWLCNVTNDHMPDLRRTYLEAYDCNVIGIDWTEYSIDYYVNSFCFIPQIAKAVGKFFCKLQKELKLDFDTVHALGHSMGGQMAGLIGQEVQAQCKTSLGRITGLDPAGPLYQGIAESRRLSEKDARFVDVIHSNQGFLGYLGNCGKIDFYPNCGTLQRGCMKSHIASIKDLLNLPTKTVACNHLRSIVYMNESITSERFVSDSCRNCPEGSLIGTCGGIMLKPSKAIMGEHVDENAPFYIYHLKTNKKPPFARG